MKKKIIIIILLMLLTVFVGAGVYAYQFLNKPFSPSEETTSDITGTVEEPVVVQPIQDNKVNILLIGTDQRTSEPSRSDSLLMLSVDTDSGKAFLVSIPRDSYVNIPGHGLDKITHAHAFGGINLTVQSVQGLFGVPINYYVRTNFEGFKKVINILGGITIKVDKPMIYERIGANFQPGVYNMNGEQALAYVRFRSDEGNDFSRMARQQTFLKQVLLESKKPSNFIKIPKLLPAIQQTVTTNMTPADALRYGKTLQDSGLETITLTGEGTSINGIYYLKLDQKGLEKIKGRLSAK